MSRAVVIDYGMGNIGSVAGAVEYLGHEAVVTNEPGEIEKAAYLILPGVGSFSTAMASLRLSKLDKAIQSAVLGGGARLLGICLGMQLLADYGSEGGGSEGLGLVPGSVEPFNGSTSDRKQLHVGFAGVQVEKPGILFQGIPAGTDFYFVHEFRMLDDGLDNSWTRGYSDHSERFLSSVERDNIMGVQFHPEKSQTNGLALLRNFLER